MNAIVQMRGVRSQSCDSCPARDQGVCAYVPDQVYSALGARSQHTQIAAGRPISNQGDPSDRIGTIISGVAKVVYATENGDEHVLQLLQTGDLIGDPFGTEHVVSCEAVSDVTLCWLPRTALGQILEDSPCLYRGYLAVLVRQLDQQHLWNASMRGRSTIERIAYWLLQTTPEDAGERPALIDVALTRRDLASLLNMTIETLCRGLHQLSDRRAIRMLAPDRIEIIAPDRLRDVARWTEDGVTRMLRSNFIEHGRHSASNCRPERRILERIVS